LERDCGFLHNLALRRRWKRDPQAVFQLFQTIPRKAAPVGASAPATLLTKCLPGRDKRRLGPGRPHLFAPKWQTPAVTAASRRAQEARIMAVSDGFRWAVNRVNSFP